MSHHTFQHYIFDVDIPLEPTVNYQANPQAILADLRCQLESRRFPNSVAPLPIPALITPAVHLPIDPWKPSKKFSRLLLNFSSSILNQFICAPCAFCGRLMYPERCDWVGYDETLAYPLLEAYPELEPGSLLIFNTKLPERVAVCSSCKSPGKRYPFPFLHPVPIEIQNVPLKKRMYLSPVFMHCSLGRSSGSAAVYSEYRTLTGTMNFSKNMRSLTLYSGMLGAYLEDGSASNSANYWIDDTLVAAANWLKQHNPFLKSYSCLLDSPGSARANPFPSASHLPDDDSAPPYLADDIVVPNVNFNVEVHDEDYHYSHLMAGFVRSPDNTLLPLAVNDPNLEVR